MRRFYTDASEAKTPLIAPNSASVALALEDVDRMAADETGATGDDGDLPGRQAALMTFIVRTLK
jgi:hypothetical protein